MTRGSFALFNASFPRPPQSSQWLRPTVLFNSQAGPHLHPSWLPQLYRSSANTLQHLTPRYLSQLAWSVATLQLQQQKAEKKEERKGGAGKPVDQQQQQQQERYMKQKNKQQQEQQSQEGCATQRNEQQQQQLHQNLHTASHSEASSYPHWLHNVLRASAGPNFFSGTAGAGAHR